MINIDLLVPVIVFLIGLALVFSLVNTDSILSTMNPAGDKIFIEELISQVQLVITPLPRDHRA